MYTATDKSHTLTTEIVTLYFYSTTYVSKIIVISMTKQTSWHHWNRSKKLNPTGIPINFPIDSWKSTKLATALRSVNESITCYYIDVSFHVNEQPKLELIQEQHIEYWMLGRKISGIFRKKIVQLFNFLVAFGLSILNSFWLLALVTEFCICTDSYIFSL